MDPHHRLSPRERLLRIGGGVGLAAVGCVIFAVSQANDPDNKWAFAGILAIIFGLSYAGPGVRGRREGVVEATAVPAAVPDAAPISAEKTVAGMLAAWFVPGLGHWIIGRRSKAILFFVTITTCFLAGALFAQGRNFDLDKDWIYFFAYGFNAGETLIAMVCTSHLELDKQIPHLHLGFLYCAVASLLNLVAMMDFVSTCGRHPAAPAGAKDTTEDAS